MIIRNGLVFRGDGFEEKDLSFEDGIITDVAPHGSKTGASYDAQGAYVVPGFVDIHTHGCMICDFCDVSSADIERIMALCGNQGVTSIALTAVSYGDNTLKKILHVAQPYLGKKGYGASLRIGESFDKTEYVEMICDGALFHPSVVRAMFKRFGAQRVCLVSYRSRSTEMADGEYAFVGYTAAKNGGQTNPVNGGGTAQSAMSLTDCFRYAVEIGIPIEDAVRAASYNPACAVSIASNVGSLVPGKSADILVMDSDLKLVDVFIAGERQNAVSSEFGVRS